MIRGQLIHHCLLLDQVEIVVVDHTRLFVVDRRRQELRSLQHSDEVLPLVQQQSGRLPNGDLELLERYCDVRDDSNSVVLDSSPSWLERLPRLKVPIFS